MSLTTYDRLYGKGYAEWTNRHYDVAIVGGGIYGACVARDAAFRGLSVLLLEKGDFGSATSGNSHKILHGGLRYLQHFDFKRMRESIRERSVAMKIAPHLTRPMPFLIPTYASSSQSKWLFSLALKINDLVSYDRNRHLPPDKLLPKSRVLSASEVRRICPSLSGQNLTGGAVFYDAQVCNPDRYVLSILQAAAQRGARIANYAEVLEIEHEGSTATRLRVWDGRTNQELSFQAKVVVNCGGPWVTKVLPTHDQVALHHIRWLKAIVLVSRPLTREIAVGVPGAFEFRDRDAVIKKGFRYFFITPWRNRSLIGTFQRPYDGNLDTFEVRQSDIDELLQQINQALPGAQLGRDDVYFVNRGLLPMSGEGHETEEAQWMKHYTIYDHGRDGMNGLISVVGVKFTTARDVAEKVVDLVQRKLGQVVRPSGTASTPVYGGDMDDFASFRQTAIERCRSQVSLSEACLDNLLQTYGTRYGDVLQYGASSKAWLEPVCSDSLVIKGQIRHAVRHEMARALSDVIFRRTDLGTAGYPGEECLRQCATIMAQDLGWNSRKIEDEIEDVRQIYSRRGVTVCPSIEPCAS